MMESFSKRLNYAMQVLGFTQKNLAMAIGISQQAVQYLCSSNVQKSKFNYEIANALKIDPVWLATGEGEMRPQFTEETTDFKKFNDVSSLSLEEIMALLKENKPFPNNESIQYGDLKLDNPLSISIWNNDMAPQFQSGDLVIADLTNTDTAHENQYVFVYLPSHDEILFRKLIFKNQQFFFVSENMSIKDNILPRGKKDIIFAVAKVLMRKLETL